jgi:hypothetical protein
VQLIFEILSAPFLIGKFSSKRKITAENELIFAIFANLNLQNSKKN